MLWTHTSSHLSYTLLHDPMHMYPGCLVVLKYAIHVTLFYMLPQILKAIAHCHPPLKDLNLQHTALTDDALGVLAEEFPKLQSLYLSYCRNMHDTGLAHLHRLSELHTLDLYNVPLISDDAIAQLTK